MSAPESKVILLDKIERVSQFLQETIDLDGSASEVSKLSLLSVGEYNLNSYCVGECGSESGLCQCGISFPGLVLLLAFVLQISESSS